MASSTEPSPELRITDEQRMNLLRMMAGREAAATKKSARALSRQTYVPAIAPMVELEGTPTAFVVVARNLSEAGFAFMHGAPAEAGTRCTVTLFYPTGAPAPITGVIVRCQKIAGRIHDLGVKFDAPIEALRFLAASSRGRKLGLPPLGGAAHEGGMDSAGVLKQLKEAMMRLASLESAGGANDEMLAAVRDVAELCHAVTGCLSQGA